MDSLSGRDAVCDFDEEDMPDSEMEGVPSVAETVGDVDRLCERGGVSVRVGAITIKLHERTTLPAAWPVAELLHHSVNVSPALSAIPPLAAVGRLIVVSVAGLVPHPLHAVNPVALSRMLRRHALLLSGAMTSATLPLR